MKQSTLILIIGITIMIFTYMQVQDKKQWGPSINPIVNPIVTEGLVTAGLAARKMKEEGNMATIKQAGIMSFLASKTFLILAVFVLIWLFGGADFILKNPIVIIFGILALILTSGGKK